MKILCLGNNTELTDTETTELANAVGSINHGLLSELGQSLEIPTHNGYYHTSVYDISIGNLFELGKQFDQVIVLGQLKEDYSHPNAFYKTIQLANKLKDFVPVKFLIPNQAQDILFFENLVNTNKSFCIFPFIELLAINSHTTVCCRSTHPVTKLSEFVDFYTDKNYQEIRRKMLAGEKLPEHCSYCYATEDKGMTSARQQETVEWANQLDLTSVEDLEHIKNPVYFEVRPSNTCNLQCRTCGPSFSHLLSKEYVKIGIHQVEYKPTHPDFSLINLDTVKKLYVAGGEPLAMPEFYDFVDRCINNNHQFEFVVNTNATKINSRFRKQLTQLPHLQFIVSIDGYDHLNHYIRWPSNWSTIISNVTYLINQGHVVSFNVTVSIYNVFCLYQLLSFLDKTFPNILVHCQAAKSKDDHLSAFNFPDAPAVVENLTLVTDLNCYKNDNLLASFIDGLIDHYRTRTEFNHTQLREFFKYNDLLDQNRNIYLRDYIPELEKYR